MQERLLEFLQCPKCHGSLNLTSEKIEGNEIITGSLQCSNCQVIFPIKNGIPRFIDAGNYGSSFGYQWNKFKVEQLDSYNGTDISAKRIYSETGWSKEWLKGKLVLDVGCGAGRFIDVISQNDCEIIGVDISSAVDAARDNLNGRKNVHLVQASAYELPFRQNIFDGCYCIGVIQHTPKPADTLVSFFDVLKEGGKLAVTIYERRLWTLLYPKYVIRPITKRMSKETLLKTIETIMPVAFPVTNVLFRIPLLKKLFVFAIPIANYVDEKSLTTEERYKWAILDTFDAFSPEYDQPQTQKDVEKSLRKAGAVEIKRLKNLGLNIVGQKGAIKAG
jgi:ubiquinone/menaquinone biosynthesis C-methylase UbiE/uncharacterized protein YbaR (Trm112 family)